MKRILVKVLYFFKSKSFLKYLVVTILLTLLFVTIGFLLQILFKSDVIETVLATAFGFAVSNVVIYFLGAFSRLFEDKIKVNTSTKDLLKIYRNPNYKKVVTFKNGSVQICYNPLVVNAQNDYKFKVIDDPKKNFEVPDFVGENYNELFTLHASSSIENTETIRLDDVVESKEKEYTFYLSRSNFYNHLVTNRAIDYEIERNLSLRSLYEYGPSLNPLNESVFSNHIGINALVFLEDGHILFPQRKKDSTISKNCITASIATRLFAPNNQGSIDEKYLFEGCIYESLIKRLHIDIEKLGKENIEIVFLGVGQNVYEGGKPQMYFSIKLKGVDVSNYKDYQYKLNVTHTKIDNDKMIHVCKFDDILLEKGGASGLKINSYNFDTKSYKTYKLQVEKSLLCNIWHYQENQKKNLVMFDCFGVIVSSTLPRWFEKQFGKEKGKELCDYYCSRGDKGELSFKEIAYSIQSNYGIKAKRMIRECIKSVKVNKDILALINNIRKTNEIVLASNACEGLVETVFKRYHLTNYFDRIFVSYSMGAIKPQSEFYQKIIYSYNRKFDHIFMIDDRKINLENLNKLNIKSVHFGPETNINELNQELIK